MYTSSGHLAFARPWAAVGPNWLQTGIQNLEVCNMLAETFPYYSKDGFQIELSIVLCKFLSIHFFVQGVINSFAHLRVYF